MTASPQSAAQGRTTPEADPQVLKAVAHPVRLRLYEALVAEGPSTNARLARHIPGAPGSLSYHLRQLARYGFIEEAPELAGDARERWWRAVPGGLHWSEESLEDNPGAQNAAAAAQSILLARQIARMRAWVNGGQGQWDLQWRSASVNTDTVLHLTPEELREFADDVAAMLDRWLGRSGHGTLGSTTVDSDERESVFVAVHAFPFSPYAISEQPEGDWGEA